MSAPMQTWITLLRGINVGGNKKIKMDALKSCYVALGFTDVHTLLQSGNVVFRTSRVDSEDGITLTAAMTAAIEQAILQTFGFEVSVITLSVDALQALIAAHPYTDAQLTTPDKLLLMFQREAISAATFEQLNQAHTGNDLMWHGDKVLYLYYPDGMGRSKLDHAWLQRQLKIVMTGRNWNTVNKLLTLAKTLQ